MTKHALHLMTWKEVDEAFKKDPVILIPMGSMEQHGPQSITGDYLAAEEIAKRTAEATGAYYLPVIPFGCSEYFRGFPGTISLQSETVYAVLYDVYQSLLEHGVTKIFVVNGHAGNVPTIAQVARKVRRESRIVSVSVDLWQSLTPELKKIVYTKADDKAGHGSEPLTSVMTCLYPDMMRMDLVDKENDNKDSWGEFSIQALTKGEVNGVPMNIYVDMEDVSKQGVMGNPLNATAERGEMIIRHLVTLCTTIVEKLKKTNTVL
jgi:creatinine amidohydrolase